jgi:uncharacterized protein
MKRTTLLALLLLLLLPTAALPSFAEKVSTTQAPTGYIDDYAQVFSADGKSNMETICRELHDKTKAQVFVVTISTTEGEPVETFANELFAKWKIGEKKTDRGVLMLFAIKDRKRWIEIGYGLEGILNDAKVGDIGRTMVPALKAANYDEAAQTGLHQITQIISTDAGVTLDALSNSTEAQTTVPAPVTGPPTSSESLSPFRWLFLAPFLIPILLFIFIFSTIVRAARRRALMGGGSSGYIGGSSFGSSDNSSSDFGGSSDSGSDFGGGDGGSSGGGGAGGDW